MPTLTTQPTIIPPVGTKPQFIEEYAGHVTTKNEAARTALIVSPPGSAGNGGGQPEFAETKVGLKGKIQVKHKEGVLVIET